jgi:hypothetical protein
MKTKEVTKRKPVMDSKTVERRNTVIHNLEKQLKSGKKPLKVEGKTHPKKEVELTEIDIKRISNELETLKSRV